MVDYRHQLKISLWWSRRRHPIIWQGGEVHGLVLKGFLGITGGCEVEVFHFHLHGIAAQG
jgi:hypothetical protein